VQFVERSLEELQQRQIGLNGPMRSRSSLWRKSPTLNQQTYELFARPLIQAIANDVTPKGCGPFIRCAFSTGRSQISILGWHGLAGGWDGESPPPRVGSDAAARRLERVMSDLVSASLDCIAMARRG